MTAKRHRCTFCGKFSDEVGLLIAGPAADLFICDECVDLCGEIVADARNKEVKKDEPASNPE